MDADDCPGSENFRSRPERQDLSGCCQRVEWHPDISRHLETEKSGRLVMENRSSHDHLRKTSLSWKHFLFMEVTAQDVVGEMLIQ